VRVLPEESGRDSSKVIYVLDTSALIVGLGHAAGKEAVTCKDILEEARHGEVVKIRAIVAEESGIKIIEPEEEYIEKIRLEADKIGELTEFSIADLKLLALALQLLDSGKNPIILTSDYSIQNLAKILGIEVEPVLHPGVRKTIRWAAYCPVCGWRGGVFRGGYCPRCGSRLKRRPIS